MQLPSVANRRGRCYMCGKTFDVGDEIKFVPNIFQREGKLPVHAKCVDDAMVQDELERAMRTGDI